MIRQIGRGLAAVGQKFYSRIFERLTIGLAVFDNQGTVIHANKKFTNLFGPSPSLARSHAFLEMLNLSPSKLLKFFASNRLSHDFEGASARLQNGQPAVYLNYRLIRIKPNRILIEVRDVTKERTEDFSPKKDLQRIIEAGENAFRIVHALKGASTTFRNILDLLGSNPSPDHFLQYLPILNRLSQRISTIINEILRIGSRREIEYKEINLADLLAQIKDLPEITAKLKNIELNILGSCSPIEGVEEELREAFVCLIDNAIEAIIGTGRADGKISVEIREEAAEPEEVVLVIRDNGPGIPPDRLSSIFRPFFTTKREGSGLGLAIARKEIEEVHGGKITVTSRVGEGTDFVINLPHKPSKAPFLDKPSGISEKIQRVRQNIASLGDIYSAFAEGCINSMTLEHLRECSADELSNQIKGQIDRLSEFLKTGQPHISVNNFSRRTEVVLCADKDSTSRAFWLDLIFYELGKLGVGELSNVVATRIIEHKGAVCRIFEIRKYKGEKLTENERQRLERALAEKFTPLPSLEELEAQNAFLRSAYKSLQSLGKPGKHPKLDLQPIAKGRHS